MRTKNIFWFAVAAFAWLGCGPKPEYAEPGALEESAESLGEAAVSASTTAMGCTFTIGSQIRTGTLPPLYDVVVQRLASAGCPLEPASVILGSSFAQPNVSIAGQAQRLAASFSTKSTPSGSAHVSVGIARLDPSTLAVVRRTSLAAMSPGPTQPQLGNVFNAELSIASNALIAAGTKNGIIPGATGSGDNYIALYVGFFTGTAPNPAPNLVVTY